MKLLLIISTAILLASCAQYTWVDKSDCKEEVGTFGKCREIQ